MTFPKFRLAALPVLATFFTASTFSLEEASEGDFRGINDIALAGDFPPVRRGPKLMEAGDLAPVVLTSCLLLSGCLGAISICS